MKKENEGAVLFAATVLAIGLVALAGSLDYSTPTGFAVGTPPNAGNTCENEPCPEGLMCTDHFGTKVCKQKLEVK